MTGKLERDTLQIDRRRRLETGLARVTLAGLVIYAPLETMASWQMVGGAHVLVHPGFLQSVVAFGLLLWGPLRSLGARPRPAPAVMCIAHAWCASLFWHASTVRLAAMKRGLDMFYGASELWVVWIGTLAALTFFGCSFWLTVKAESTGDKLPPIGYTAMLSSQGQPDNRDA